MEPLLKRSSSISSCDIESHGDSEAGFDRTFVERGRRRSDRSDRWSREFDCYHHRSSSRGSSRSVPDTLRRRDFNVDYITSTELIRKPLLNKR